MQFADVSLEVRPTPPESVNLDFLARFIPKLAYPELVATARSLGYGEDKLPDEMPESLLPGGSSKSPEAAASGGDAEMDDDEEDVDEDSRYSAEEKEFLQQLWHVLMEVHVESGAMICRGCGHRYNIEAGIPNMVGRGTAVRRAKI